MMLLRGIFHNVKWHWSNMRRLCMHFLCCESNHSFSPFKQEWELLPAHFSLLLCHSSWEQKKYFPLSLASRQKGHQNARCEERNLLPSWICLHWSKKWGGRITPTCEWEKILPDDDGRREWKGQFFKRITFSRSLVRLSTRSCSFPLTLGRDYLTWKGCLHGWLHWLSERGLAVSACDRERMFTLHHRGDFSGT